MREIRVVETAADVARQGAEELARDADRAHAAGRDFTVALAGGSTPRAMYRLLADPSAPYVVPIAWNRIRFYFGDERSVPPDHPDSNYRMALETLLSKVPVRPGSVARFRSEGDDPEAVAAEYEQILRQSFGIGQNDAPRFDLVLLGMGEDGHTASLFPGSAALRASSRLAVAPYVEKLDTHRYTVTPAVLNAAARVVFLVSGAAKAQALRAVLQGERRPDTYPAQIVEPDRGELLWLVDAEAARLLA